MPKDQKVGLALGVLLVGAVAALFFRHDEAHGTTAPALKSAAALDAQLAQQQHSTYAGGHDPLTGRPMVPARIVSGAPGRPDSFLPSLEGPLFPGDPTADGGLGSPTLTFDDAPGMTEPNYEFGPAPDPIAPEPPAERAIDRAVPAPDLEGESVQRSTPGPLTQALQSTTHTVQRGETLSSIANKYLGSPKRFHELFEANRHLLRDANDVQPGLVLTIPAAPAEGPRPAASTKSAAPEPASQANGGAPSTTSSPVPTPATTNAGPLLPGIEDIPMLPGEAGSPASGPTDDVLAPAIELPGIVDEPAEHAPSTPISPLPAEPAKPKKFVPFGRSPLNPRSATRPTNAGELTPATTDAAKGRRLSQLPPVGEETRWR